MKPPRSESNTRTLGTLAETLCLSLHHDCGGHHACLVYAAAPTVEPPEIFAVSDPAVASHREAVRRIVTMAASGGARDACMLLSLPGIGAGMVRSSTRGVALAALCGLDALSLNEEQQASLRRVAELLGQMLDATAQSQALARDRSRWQDFAELAGYWWWETDGQCRFTRLEGAQAAHQLPQASAWLGKTPWELAGPVDDAEDGAEERLESPPAAGIRNCMEGLLPFKEMDLFWLDRQGVRHCYALSGRPVTDDAGHVLGYRGVGCDQSRQVQQDEAMHNQLQQLRSMIASAPLPIYAFDHQGCIIKWNAAAERLYGWGAQDMMGVSLQESPLIPDELREEAYGLWQEAMSGKTLTNRELIRRRRDGATLVVRAALAPMFSTRHTVEGVVVLVADITAQKQAEATLHAEQIRAEVTLAAIGDGVIRVDRCGQVEYLNPVAELFVGMSQSEARGLPFSQVFRAVDPITRRIPEDMVARALVDGLKHNRSSAVQLQREDGWEFAVEDSVAAVRDERGAVVGAVVVFHDVSHAQRMAAQITYQATHDSLTGLINRHEFERRLDMAIETGVAGSTEHALLYLDLDQFKVVNDTCGHIAGDELLRQLTSVLVARLRRADTLARMGGDEFGVLLEDCPVSRAQEIAHTLRELVENFDFLWEGRSFSLGVSIGLVAFGSDGRDRTALLAAADAACYLAKEKGRNRVHVYRPDDEETLARHGEMEWVGRVRQALTENRLRLYFQEIHPMEPEQQGHAHFELLIRMLDERGTLVPPGAFIPAAERFGLMPQIDRWVIRTAFSQFYRLHPRGIPIDVCSINLSGMSLNDEGLLQFVAEELTRTGVPAERICFEITETAAIANLGRARQLIQGMRSLGCKFALDDFGVGMSSFGYLKHLPVDYLKIDGSLVRDIASDDIDCTMVDAIHRVGRAMGLHTIAEFVENDAIRKRLADLGVDFVQGYGIHKPEPAAFHRIEYSSIVL